MRVNGAGGIALARGENDIEQAIRIILGTARGERRMRPNFAQFMTSSSRRTTNRPGDSPVTPWKKLSAGGTGASTWSR